MKSIRQSLQAQPNNIKKFAPNQPIEIKKISNKSMFSISTLKEGKNSYGGYPTMFGSSTQNPKKNIRTPNLPNRTNIFPKKYV
jgi:hypothetical protein